MELSWNLIDTCHEKVLAYQVASSFKMKESLRFIGHTQYLLPEVLSWKTFFDNTIAIVWLPLLDSILNSRMILKFIEILHWLHNDHLHLSTTTSQSLIFSSVDILHFRGLAISLVAQSKLISLMNGATAKYCLCSVWTDQKFQTLSGVKSQVSLGNKPFLPLLLCPSPPPVPQDLRVLTLIYSKLFCKHRKATVFIPWEKCTLQGKYVNHGYSIQQHSKLLLSEDSEHTLLLHQSCAWQGIFLTILLPLKQTRQELSFPLSEGPSATTLGQSSIQFTSTLITGWLANG